MRGGPGSTKGWSLGAEFAPRRLCEECGERFYAPPSLIRRGGGRFCSKSCRATWQLRAGVGFGDARARRGKRGFRTDIGLYMRSEWEANWARWLAWMQSTGNVLGWAYEPDSFALTIDGKRVRYVPDFKVEWNGKTEYHEVKGLMDKRSAQKICAMRRQHPQVRLVVVNERVYKGLARRFEQIVPNWTQARRALG